MIQHLVHGYNAKPSKYERVHVKNAGVLRDGKMVITPEIAERMLEHNTRNRPMSQNTVKHYARQMLTGEWRYTRVPIIFSNAGRLIDGQHRLSAVVMANVPIEADVALDAPDEAFAFIDNGKKRSAGDVFAINEVPNAATMAAATWWVAQYERGNFTAGGGGGNRPTSAQLYEIYLGHADLQLSYTAGRRFGEQKLCSPSMMTALHYICAKKCRRDADQFFEAAATGFGARDRRDPALTLHHKLVKNASSQETLSSRSLAGLTLTAWNLYRRGRVGGALRYDSEKAAPRAI